MALSINYPDKILAGLNQSYTLTSSSGAPSGEIRVDGVAVPHRVILLGIPKTHTGDGPPEEKYKVSFLLPADSVGKKLELAFAAGDGRVEESQDILAE